jgi:CBS domain-containing protein
MGTVNIAAADAGPTVGDVMLRDPEVHPSSSTVGDVRAAFESPKQKLFLIADGTRYVGAVVRESEGGAPNTAPVTELDTHAVPTVTPDDPVSRIYDLANTYNLSRIPVVDADGTLHGLVCFNRTAESFCVA